MALKNIDFWEKLLKNMPNSYRRWFKEERKYLLKHITKNAKVLEVGCGDGRSIKDILDVTTNIVGIDHDEKAVADVKNNFKDYKTIRILKAKAENLPFENKEFDFVICMTTFANFADSKQKVLSEMKRVLKDDGFIIISVFSEDAFEERMKIYKKLNFPIKEIKGTTVIFNEEIGDNVSEQFSKEQLVGVFSKANLSVVDIKKKGIAYLCKLKK
ncbi:class I SAM-dependent methyltransferase [Candidatus Woesearchaeota archaeon]|nr:class I SAM-dependent methyltransferase [Candidatus Woesearchaeota archaeon]